MDDDPRYEPTSVEAKASIGVRIGWSDGHVSTWTLEAIRDACRCADCGERRRVGQPVRRGDIEVDVVDADLVGAYGISFVWNDGHATGIYHWTRLRDGCPCDDCVTERFSAGRTDPLA